MNFFEQQDKARKRTSKLVIYFILAIVLIIAAVDALILGTLIYGTYPDSSQTIQYTINEEPATLVKAGKIDFRVLSMLAATIAIGVTPCILIVIGIGTLIRLAQTRKGGVSVAEMVKARSIDHSTQDFKEKRFINIVEEMSLASGVPQPQLFIMDKEPAINAFVAGVHPNDMVMVVTQGALDNLDRDALQGVVGHEFSHIFNGDMRINLKLIGLLGGIFVIGQLGAFILRSLSYRSSSSSSSSSSNSKGNGTLMIVVFGIGLFIIGYIGLFFGRLIKAAVSRQRESLADACGVQYTRNPQGLISALRAIKEAEKGSQLKSSHAEDINHMCFGPSLNMWFSHLLASHPPLEQRIQALDPDGNFPITAQKRTLAPHKPIKSTQNPHAMGVIMLTTLENSIGNPNLAHIDYAAQLLADIPETLMHASYNPQDIVLLLYATLMPEEESVRQQINTLLASELNQEELAKMAEYHKEISSLGHQMILPLVDIMLPTFRRKNVEDKTKAIAVFEKMASLNKTLFSFCVVAMIKKSALSITPATNSKTVPVSALIPEISQLLGFMIFCIKPQNPSELFQQLMTAFTDKPVTAPEILTFDPGQLQQLLSKLNTLAPLDKEKLLHACLTAIAIDGQINIEEAQAARAIAACLNCPIPPIIPTTTE